MKHKIIFLPLIILSFFLTSCIDYVQTITYKDGKFRLYCKITVSKTLMNLGETDGENTNKTIEEMKEENFSDLPSTVQGQTIDNELETGFEFSLNVDPKTTNTDEKKFLPKVRGDKYYIPLFLDFSDKQKDYLNSTSESDGIGESLGEAIGIAMLSSIKFRVLVSKKIISKIETAYFKGTSESNFPIPFYDYGESYCFEIPVLFLTKCDGYDLSRIVVLKETDN